MPFHRSEVGSFFFAFAFWVAQWELRMSETALRLISYMVYNLLNTLVLSSSETRNLHKTRNWPRKGTGNRQKLENFEVFFEVFFFVYLEFIFEFFVISSFLSMVDEVRKKLILLRKSLKCQDIASCSTILDCSHSHSLGKTDHPDYGSYPRCSERP